MLMSWLKKICIASVPALLIAGTLFLAGCEGNSEKIPDTSRIQVNLETHRFDVDLYAIDTNNIGVGLTALRAKYPDFLDYFLDTLMAYGIKGNYSDTVTGIREGLRPFLAYKDYKDLEDFIKRLYPDTKSIDKLLTDAFKLQKHYFPAYKVPRIMYMNMGLSNWAAFPVDSNTHCIGLDMFLGDEFPFYASLGHPQYLRLHRRKPYIPVAVFSSIFREAMPLQTQEKNLLQLMLHRGKEQYYLHKILPALPDSVLFGFPEKQMKWCESNEAFTYNFFVKNELLFSREAQNIMPYITDGPFARGMEPAGSANNVTPGNIGTWLGYKMITAWMEQHPDVSLQQLMATQFNPETFLADAKYKPR
jgi:hypothetical protein